MSLEKLNHKIKLFCLDGSTISLYVHTRGQYLINSTIDSLMGEEQTDTTIFFTFKDQTVQM